MDMKDCIEFVRGDPTCYLATMEEDQPRVRAFMCWMADETGFYFDTADYKDTWKQLNENRKCECCFYNGKKMLRISGEIERNDDSEIRKKLFKDKPDNPKTVIFFIPHGEVLVWWREDGKSQREKLIF